MTFSCLQRPSTLVARLSRVAILVAALSGSSAAAMAQVLYGSLVGNVTDATRGAVPGALVTITHKETGASREATTDAAGAFHFPAVQSGTYTIVVKLDGFRTFTRS